MRIAEKLRKYRVNIGSKIQASDGGLFLTNADRPFIYYFIFYITDDCNIIISFQTSFNNSCCQSLGCTRNVDKIRLRVIE